MMSGASNNCSQCTACGQWHYGFHQCAYTYYVPTQSPNPQWLVGELIRLSEENGRLKVELDALKKK
jgi:hypothetical protein